LKVDLGEITLDLAAAGYGMVLKDHQLKAMKYLWSLDGDGASSREVWMAVNQGLTGRDTTSRASVINFLNKMVDNSVLQFDEVTGKGGRRRIYRSETGETGFKCYIVELTVGKLFSSFPEEFQRALESIPDTPFSDAGI
jgi:hypothetical protein